MSDFINGLSEFRSIMSFFRDVIVNVLNIQVPLGSTLSISWGVLIAGIIMLFIIFNMFFAILGVVTSYKSTMHEIDPMYSPGSRLPAHKEKASASSESRSYRPGKFYTGGFRKRSRR